MMAYAHVKLDLKALRTFNGNAMAAIRNAGHTGPIGDVYKKWIVRYRSFISKRFDSASKGDGTWQPLKQSTVLARARRTVTRAREQIQRKAAAAEFSGKAMNSERAEKTLWAAQMRYRKEKKRIVSGTSKVAILRDTGSLFQALSPTATGPGGLTKFLTGGVEIGYGGMARYTSSHGTSGKATISDIAFFHDTGAGHLPQRKIIVPPDAATLAAMTKDMEVGLQRLAKETHN